MSKLPKQEASYWLDSTENPGYPKLKADIQTDVAIVGAGIAGLSAAYLLKQAGLKVVVTDKTAIGAGVSGHTTGKVSSQHNLIYKKLTQRLGLPAARKYGEANEAAIRKIEEIVTKEGIDCDWSRDDNYVYTTDAARALNFREEAAAAIACGLPASFETETPLPFSTRAAVKFAGQAKFHVRKYLLGLARAIEGDGSHIFEHSRAIGIREGQVRTPAAKISAQYVIVATNVPSFPLMARGGYCISEYPQKSYIVAGEIENKLPGMYISPDKGQYSILPIATGNKNLLLIGGEGHIPGTRPDINARFQRLANYAADKFGVKQIDYHWSARDYLGYDDRPLIGKLYPWSINTYMATAFMKWGLTNGTVAGMILSDLIQGKANPWASTFDSLRLKAITSIPKVIKEKITG